MTEHQSPAMLVPFIVFFHGHQPCTDRHRLILRLRLSLIPGRTRVAGAMAQSPLGRARQPRTQRSTLPKRDRGRTLSLAPEASLAAREAAG